MLGESLGDKGEENESVQRMRKTPLSGTWSQDRIREERCGGVVNIPELEAPKDDLRAMGTPPSSNSLLLRHKVLWNSSVYQDTKHSPAGTSVFP